MGSYHLLLESDDFELEVHRDRSDGPESIIVGASRRPRPRAHLRRHSLGKIRGFLEQGDEPYAFPDFDAQIRWLVSNRERVLDVEFLNSDELKRWANTWARKAF